MMKQVKKIELSIAFILIIICGNLLKAQTLTSLKGINFQGIVKDTSTSVFNPVFPFNVKFSITKGNAGIVYFQETQTVSSLNNGLFNLTIGNGVPTGIGLYSQIDLISPFQDSLFLKVELDLYGSGYQLFSKHLFKSVAFSLYSKYSLDTISSQNLQDVTSPFAVNDFLMWNGSSWVSTNDQFSTDTILFSQNTDYSNTSDTATYAYISQQMNTDTVLYSFNSDTSDFALTSLNASTSDTAQYATIAGTADSVIYAWHLKGNYSLPQFYLGTQDTATFILKTNNLKRFQVNSAGQLAIGSVIGGQAEFTLSGNNGFLFFRNTYSSSLYTAPMNTPVYLFNSDSAAFRAGTASASQFNSANLGLCSFGFGRDLIVKSRASTAFGDSCEIKAIPPPGTFTAPFTDGTNAFAFGKNCKANGQLSFAVGYRTEALMYRNIAMGYKCKTESNSANIALGYMATATGSTAASFGYKTFAPGHKSVAIGSCAQSTSGSFVFGDASTTDTVKNTVMNQFMVRASGGTVFYTDTALASGVELFPGAGAWNSLSDSTKKTNFLLLDSDAYLKEFSLMNVYTWNYKSQENKIRHMGPTAQTFYRLYGFGENDVSINLIDADGITMQMIKVVMKKMTITDNEFCSKLPQLKSEIADFNYDGLNEQLIRLQEITKSIENE